MSTQISSVKFGTTNITKVNINNTLYFWPNHTTDITHSGGCTVHGDKQGVYVLRCWTDSYWGEHSTISLSWYGHNTYGAVAADPTNTHYNFICWTVSFYVAGVYYSDSEDWMVRDGTTETPKSKNVGKSWVETRSTPIKNLYMN